MYVNQLLCRNFSFLFVDHDNMEKNIGFFSKIVEIFITALAAQLAQKVEKLLMQNWVFRLGLELL